MSVELMDRPAAALANYHEVARPVAGARERIRPYIGMSALTHHETLPGNIRLLTKMESENITGSYKERGALNALLQHRYPHLLASAGNFGGGGAWAAHLLGVRLEIGVPETTPESKLARIRELGGNAVTLTIIGRTFDETRHSMRAKSARQGTPFLEPFDDLDVLYGQGTSPAEVLEQDPMTKRIFVPVGGAGLLAGTMQAIEEAGTDTMVVPVQLQGNDSLERSLNAGHVVEASNVNSLCDGIAVRRIGQTCFRLIQQYRHRIADIVTVSPAEVGREIYHEDLKRQPLVPVYGEETAFSHFPETTGFVALAGARQYAESSDNHHNETWVAMVTGSNTDPARESIALDAYLSTLRQQN